MTGQEVRIVPRSREEGEPPVGLRLLKSIKTSKDDSYLIPLPGFAPPAFHLSIHPSGELHLKDKEHGTIARLNLTDLLSALRSGALDEVFAEILTPPADGQAASGMVARPGAIPGLSGPESDKKTDLEISVADMLGAFTQVEISNTTDIAGHISWLRREGHLPVRGILLLHMEGTENPTVFMNAIQDEPSEGSAVTIPEGLPMRRTLETLVNQVRKYGGFFVTFPEDSKLRALAQRAGFGEFYDGLTKFMDKADESQVEAMMKDFVRELEVVAAETAAVFLTRPPLRPELPPKDHA